MPKIPQGFILKARVIQNKKLSHCSPAVREIWDWLLMNAQYKPVEYNGYKLLRGQLFTNYKDIREGLAWHVGYRKIRYSEDVTKAAMKTLRSLCAATTMKTPRGIVVTIVNYDFYQNPKNYEDPNEDPNEDPSKTPVRPQHSPSIIKEGNEGNEGKKEKKTTNNHPKDLAEMIDYCKTKLDWDISEASARSIWQYYCPPGGDEIWRDKKGVLVVDWHKRMVTCKKNDNGAPRDQTPPREDPEETLKRLQAKGYC